MVSLEANAHDLIGLVMVYIVGIILVAAVVMKLLFPNAIEHKSESDGIGIGNDIGDRLANKQNSSYIYQAYPTNGHSNGNLGANMHHVNYGYNDVTDRYGSYGGYGGYGHYGHAGMVRGMGSGYDGYGYGGNDGNNGYNKYNGSPLSGGYGVTHIDDGYDNYHGYDQHFKERNNWTKNEFEHNSNNLTRPSKRHNGFDYGNARNTPQNTPQNTLRNSQQNGSKYGYSMNDIKQSKIESMKWYPVLNGKRPIAMTRMKPKMNGNATIKANTIVKRSKTSTLTHNVQNRQNANIPIANKNDDGKPKVFLRVGNEKNKSTMSYPSGNDVNKEERKQQENEMKPATQVPKVLPKAVPKTVPAPALIPTAPVTAIKENEDTKLDRPDDTQMDKNKITNTNGNVGWTFTPGASSFEWNNNVNTGWKRKSMESDENSGSSSSSSGSEDSSDGSEPENAHQPWTVADENKLMKWYHNMPVEQIAQRLGRSVVAVRKRVSVINNRPPPRKRRRN